MRWRPFFWLLVSLMCFVGAVYFWRLGDKWEAERRATVSKPEAKADSTSRAARRTQEQSTQSASTAPTALLELSNNTAAATNSSASLRLKYRLSNTTKSLHELQNDDHSILLMNALIDSSE